MKKQKAKKSGAMAIFYPKQHTSGGDLVLFYRYWLGTALLKKKLLAHVFKGFQIVFISKVFKHVR